MFLLYPKPRCDEGIDDISIIIHRSAVALMASKLFSEIFCSYFQYTASLRLSNIGLPSDVCPDSTGSDLVHKADIPHISCNCKIQYSNGNDKSGNMSNDSKNKNINHHQYRCLHNIFRKNTEKFKKW